MRTYSVKGDEVQKDWFLVDATGQTLGRLATRIAGILTGKHKPIYTPHIDVGDHVIVVNAEKVVLTGRKLEDKLYGRHSQYPGGLKQISAKDLLKKHPERLIEYAVKGMLPNNKLRDYRMTKLRVYAGTEHPHRAQKVKNIE
jgi:large subunit ribosomal protein L13